MNRHLLFISLLVAFNTNSFCQDIIKGKVVDQQTSIALNGVEIVNESSKISVFTDSQGRFTLIAFGKYLFKKKGYISKSISVTTTSSLIIPLEVLPSELDAVLVTANQIPASIKNSTSSVAVISQADINQSNSTNIAPVLNRVPGVYMQSGALNTNRITVRGIGARNAFGTSKIRAYFKDIPLTNGSGETNIEDFELETISRIEINKGSASTYGAGLGGTILLSPFQSEYSQSQLKSRYTFGSFGLHKASFVLSHGTNSHNLNMAYSNTTSDGYRANNTYNRQTYTLNTNHFLGKNDEISLLGSYVNLKAFIPSSLNEDTFNNNPQSAAFTWQQAQGFEDSERGILGLNWTHNFSSQLNVITSAFGTIRKNYEPRPFNILSEDTKGFGLRSRILGSLFNEQLNYTIGGEYFRDNYGYSTFENLYEDFPSGTGSVQGEQLSDFSEQRQYINAFVETKYNLKTNLIFTLGLNFNTTSYELKDDFPASESNPNQSGTFNYDNIWSPKFGILYHLNDRTSLFGNASHGFSPLTLAETLLPDGQINTNLKPETGWTYEFGTRGTFFNQKLAYTIVLFRMDIKNLLVSQRIAEDQFIGINAGKTQHDGIELSLSCNLLKNEKFDLSTSFNYSLNNFKFKEFIDDDEDFSGNDLTGVPSDILNLGMTFNSHIGLSANINFQHVGQIPITDSNSIYSDSYSLLNTKINYQFKVLKSINANAFVGFNNITDTKYSSQVLINASGFGGSAPRYFYPGNPFNYYSGIILNYSF
ncbi:TonB-dependent receptor domain-containing protein [Winogradskyella sp. A3E31]|uniref:TonB-dependent receptor domain-containing protein n=1 Tax=Winogradskyella sp. A3E31 TaxID=3349637 RepID=UPI00398A6CD9